MPFPIGGPLEPIKPLSLTVSQIFNVECKAMVDIYDLHMTFKQRSIHFRAVEVAFKKPIGFLGFLKT